MEDFHKMMHDACNQLRQLQVDMVKNKRDHELIESLFDEDMGEDFRLLVKQEMQIRNQN